MSSDPEWIYVNVRRLFIFLEHSIDKSTQWAVFEPNNERLWSNIRSTIEDFLLVQWKSGALMGTKPEEAFFVRCDRTTMTQNDLDNGRLIVLIGVAPTYPAEFVIFRIGQWTADSQS
jgi:phage tail sheath protein FI